ncbi:LysM peptidoglycan-binding domain-containing protein [Candidatus Saccharibacteria bacterium]|nr:LysM peptidoglycan-binding domain-containing protein [Candidatus Saccharibacteria bacterium]
MKNNKNKHNFDWLKKTLPYFLVGAGVIGLAFLGSLDKRNNEASLSLDTFAANNYDVSVDQMSELYVVADLSDALRLASATDVASNYVITTTMRDTGQTSASKLEKPSLTNITSSRGVVEYAVKEGETMESIAAERGLTTDQIRWSNGLKTTDVSTDTTLYLPSTSGIVYTVKSGDSVESIAEKYGSSAEEIVALNDLEVSGISEGAKIVIKDGSLPETERPEYVAPAPRPTYNYTYTYLGSSSERQDIEVIGFFYNLGGPYGAGQCTQWAWYKWQQNGRTVPTNWGNANTWAAMAAASGYQVDRSPAPGAIIQSGSGWYGHVGYVEALNPDGSIVISEMNYGIPFRAIRSTIPASYVGNFNYIH